MIDPDDVSVEDKEKLNALGFNPHTEYPSFTRIDSDRHKIRY